MTGTGTAAPERAALQGPPLTVIRPGCGIKRPRPTWHHADVLEHRPAGARYRHLRLHAPSIAALSRPGQFVMLTAARTEEPGPVLPRPMAVYSTDTAAGTVEVVYGIVGAGTRHLSTYRPGERLLTVGPLGQGFHLSPTADRVLLIGRGIGTCSLTTIAQEFAKTADEDAPRAATEVVAVTSARDEQSLIGGALYRAHGVSALYEVTDAAGTSSVEALHARLVGDLDADPPQQIMTCGSERLVRLCTSLGERWGADVQVSLEAHMACGMGYCHGCASGTRGGPVESPLICRDGPVFRVDFAPEDRP